VGLLFDMRIRTIKPEFWTHEGLCKKSDFTRLLAIALLNLADDEGYFMANPILIRGQVFPFLEDSKKILGSLQDLSGVGWIRLGKDDQKRDVGKIVNFLKHQRVDKPQSSKIKPSSVFQDDSKNDLGTIQDDSKGEGKGKEGDQGKGRESNKWIPTDDQKQVASWFGRRATTEWPDDEQKAWKKLSAEIIAEGLQVLDAPYRAKVPYLKTKIITLLNNWHGEIDRWRNFKPTQKSNVTSFLPGDVDDEGNPAWLNQ